MTAGPPGQTPLQKNVATRAHFAWSMVWAGLVTCFLSIGMLVHNAVRPSPKTFKLWLSMWSRAILFGAGIRLDAEILASVPESEPVVFVANHQNMLDIVTCGAGIPHSYGFVAKADLRKTPFIGAVLKSSSSVFVDRSTPRRAAESIAEAAGVIRNGNSVLVYVEGERSFGPGLLDFLRGAFLLAVEAGVPIVPVVITNNYQVLDERRRVGRPGRAHLVVTPPISTAGLSRRDIGGLMELVRDRMRDVLDGAHRDAEGVSGGGGVSSGASHVSPS